MTTKTDEQERADFEAFARPRNYDLDAVMLLSKPPKFSHYVNQATQAAFEAYQAGRAALQSQDREVTSHRATWAGVTVWIGDKQRSYGVTREKLELSNLDALQIAFDHARRIEGET